MIKTKRVKLYKVILFMIKDKIQEFKLSEYKAHIFFSVCIVGISLNIWFSAGKSEPEPKQESIELIKDKGFYYDEFGNIVIEESHDTKEEIDQRFDTFFEGVEKYEKEKGE